MLYFGCIRTAGHYLWSSEQSKERDVGATPWGFKVDGGLCPPYDKWMKGGQPQGVAALHHKDGWTALAFWDRSVDSRPGSNSVFLAPQPLSFDEMVALAKEHFPNVWARYGFEVRSVEAAQAA